MVVTIKTDRPSDAARAEFECVKYGIDCERMADGVVQITSPTLDKVQRINATIGGTIIAVAHHVLFSGTGEY